MDTFFHFWGFKGKYPEIIYSNKEAERTYEAAIEMLEKVMINNEFEASAIVRFYDAFAEQDEIVLDNKYRLAMLRQQHNNSDYLSLADFVPSFDLNIKSTLGLFCLKVSDKLKCQDNCKDFDHLLRESLCARLTEALAEWIQQQTCEGLYAIRPAFGYSSCPDHSLKKDVIDLLEASEKIGVSLTPSYSISPSTSLCGMLIVHPEARYFSINQIGNDQFTEYCQKRNMSQEEGKKLLGNILIEETK
ncbi:MAG: hypothetical protein LIO65_08140 [Odoribacter sp.]|nr:hypothetical protein [Odoribacter sp.]